MIREMRLADLNDLNTIGQNIKENFADIYRLAEFCTYSYAHVYVYEEDKIIKGFLQVEEHFEVTDIINIAVGIPWQKQGIGTKLIMYLINHTKAKRLMLEVAESNTVALKLYRQCGFKEIHRRENYYGQTTAIIMERIIV